MDRREVSSSNLQSVGYDSPTQTLEVEFKNNKIYHYFGVPEAQYEALMAAVSVGQFFNANIRDVFPCEQVG